MQLLRWHDAFSFGNWFLLCVLASIPSVFAQQGEVPSWKNSTNSSEPSLIRGPARTPQSVNPSATPSTSHGQTGANSYSGNSNVHPNSPPSFADQQVQQASYQASTSSPSKPGAESLSLKPRSKSAEGSIDKPSSSWGAFLSVVFSLGIVLALFLGLVWMAKRSMPQSNAKLPNEVVQVLGRSTLAPRQQVYVVRFGRKLLLVSQQPGQTQTLSEIEDEDEVTRLAGICESILPSSSSRKFSDVLKQVANGKADLARSRIRRPA